MKAQQRFLMKRLTAIVLSILMAVCVLGVTRMQVWADEPLAIAEVNGNRYPSLKAALEAIQLWNPAGNRAERLN